MHCRFDGLFKWPARHGAAACRLRVLDGTPLGTLVIMTELPMSYPGAVTRGLDSLVLCVVKVFGLKDHEEALWLDESPLDPECRYSRVRFESEGNQPRRTWLEVLPEDLVKMALEGEDWRPAVLN